MEICGWKYMAADARINTLVRKVKLHTKDTKAICKFQGASKVREGQIYSTNAKTKLVDTLMETYGRC